MAKSATMTVKMLSTADTGFFYVKKKKSEKAAGKNGNEKIAYIEFDNLVPILIIELYL